MRRRFPRAWLCSCKEAIGALRPIQVCWTRPRRRNCSGRHGRGWRQWNRRRHAKEKKSRRIVARIRKKHTALWFAPFKNFVSDWNCETGLYRRARPAEVETVAVSHLFRRQKLAGARDFCVCPLPLSCPHTPIEKLQRSVQYSRRTGAVDGENHRFGTMFHPY